MPKVEEHVKVEVTVRFVRLAIAYVLIFLAAMVVGAAVTLTVSNYDPKTDFIYRYYDTFNPCIFFDHAPSSYVTSFIIILMISCGIVYALMTFILLAKETGIQYVVLGAFHVVLTIASEACFANVFTSNIYVHVNEAHLDPAVPLTDSDVSEIWFHTMWYVFWLISHIFGMMFMLHVSPVVTRKEVSPPQYFFWFIGFVGLVVGTLSLVICLDLGIEGATLKNRKNMGDFKYYVLFLHQNAQTALWHWLPVFCYRFFVPRALGIKFSFTRSSIQSKDTGLHSLSDLKTLDPSHMFDSVFGFVGILLLGGVLLGDQCTEDRSIFPVLLGLREKPFSFVFAPVWIVLSLLLALAVYLTVIREKIVNGGEWSSRIKVLAAIGFFLSLTFTQVFWIVIPQWNGTAFIVCPLLLLIPTWVIAVSWSEHSVTWRPILWCVLWFASVGCSAYYMSATFFIFLLLMMYRRITPSSAQLHLEISVVREEELCGVLRCAANFEMMANPMPQAQHEHAQANIEIVQD